jgi:hypothetical protein
VLGWGALSDRVYIWYGSLSEASATASTLERAHIDYIIILLAAKTLSQYKSLGGLCRNGLTEPLPWIPPLADVFEPPLAYIGEWLLLAVDLRVGVFEDIDGRLRKCFSTRSGSLLSDVFSSIRIPCFVSRIYHIQCRAHLFILPTTLINDKHVYID